MLAEHQQHERIPCRVACQIGQQVANEQQRAIVDHKREAERRPKTTETDSSHNRPRGRPGLADEPDATDVKREDRVNKRRDTVAPGREGCARVFHVIAGLKVGLLRRGRGSYLRRQANTQY